MTKPSPADALARECVNMYAELRLAATVLHNDVGALLAVAGLRLQLLSMDFPEARERSAQVAEAIEGAMEHVRKLSRDLEPSPVRRTGLKNALLDLALAFRGVTVHYTATAEVPPVAADALYRAVASIVAAASLAPGVKRIAVAVSGSRSVTARVAYDGPGKNAEQQLTAAALLSRHSGLKFEMRKKSDKRELIKTKHIKIGRIKTEQCTIVVIQYAARRPAGG